MPANRSRTFALSILTLGLVACVAAPGPRPVPLAPRASAAFTRARALQAAGVPADSPELREALRLAQELEPAWVAPKRLEDDLGVALHREVETLERRRDNLARDRADARSLYLVSRLEGLGGVRAFENVTRLDPSFAWGFHGLAWSLAREGRFREAQAHGERALALARDPWERAFFGLRLASYLEGERRGDAAHQLLESLARELLLEESERGWFACELALFELRQGESGLRRAGYERALDLVRKDVLSAADLERLLDALEASFSPNDPSGVELELALAGKIDASRERRLAQRWLRRSAPTLGRRVLEELDADFAEVLGRVGAFEHGVHVDAIESWRAALPDQVLDDDGLPLSPSLRGVVLAARSSAQSPGSTALEELGKCLVEAGWFREAMSLAEELARLDIEAAVDLRLRASAGHALLLDLRRTLLAIEDGSEDLSSRVGFRPRGEAPRPVEDTDLEALLERWRMPTERALLRLDGDASLDLAESPRLEYGMFAELIHPGPIYSETDALAGRGPSGERVPGLAALMARLGRFAIVGQVLGGGGPDGTILRLLHVEERSGEHLGTPWRGTIAWCEGTDLRSRAGRVGARISGAALHEGYWVDVLAVRQELQRWRALRSEFEGAGAEQRVALVLETEGLVLRAPVDLELQRRRERTRLRPGLGEADRVRLAVLRERAAAGQTLGEMELTELVQGVAVHEQGHLCDRTRFLPLSDNLPKLLLFAARMSFSPSAIQEGLEYRAQLTAMCEVADPRLPLVELLDTLDTDGATSLPHPAAYGALLSDLLELLDRKLENNPERWPALSPDHRLLHQLHRLRPDEVRFLALELARREGL